VLSLTANCFFCQLPAIKMATVLEEYNTEEHHSFVRFFVGKRLSAKDINNEMFPLCHGKCL
jgi:hypothetical protein